MPQFITVDTLSEFPIVGARQRVINVDSIRDAIQEYADPDFSNFYALDQAETGALPVVHVFLNYSLKAFPVYDPGLKFNNESIPQYPEERPTEIWIAGTLPQFALLLGMTGVTGPMVNCKLEFFKWQFEIGQAWPTELPAGAAITAGATSIILPLANILKNSLAVTVSDSPWPQYKEGEDVPERAFLPVYNEAASIISFNEGVRNGDKFVITGARMNCQEEESAQAGIPATDVSFIAGQDVSSGRIVYSLLEKVYYFDPSNENLAGKSLGITTQAALANTFVNVRFEGIFEQAGLGLTPDEKYYVGANGTLTTSSTGRNVIQQVGVSLNADSLKIKLDSSFITITTI